MKARPVNLLLAVAGLCLSAAPLFANTVSYWNFNASSNGAAILAATGTGVSAFSVSQDSSANQPTGSTGVLPSVTYCVNAVRVTGHFSASSSQYLAGPAVQPVLNFGANTAFTVEAWVYLQSYPATGSQRYIFSTRTSSSGNSGFALDVTDAGLVSFATDGGATGFTNLVSATTIALNTWYHIAGERTATGASYLYIDGVLDAQLASGNDYALASDAAPQLGASPHWSQTLWDGYIAEVRVSDAALAPAQLLYAPSTTLAYWNFNLNNDTSAVTNVPGTGAAAFNLNQSISADQPVAFAGQLPQPAYLVVPLRASARLLDASSCSYKYLVGPAVQSALNFGANSAFTVEAWVNLKSLPASGVQRYIFSTRTSSSGNSGFALDVTNTGQVSFATDGGASGFTNLVSASTLALNTWYHIAGERTASGASYLYINGVLAAQLASGNTYALASDAAPQLGASPHWSDTKWDGFIGEVRISNAALAPAQLLYNSGNVVSWTLEAASGQTYPQSVFTLGQTPAPVMRINLTALSGTLMTPTVTARVTDFWGNPAGTVSVANGPTGTEFDLSPSVTAVGWYNLVLSVTDSGNVFNAIRAKGDPQATESYNYLPFSIVPVPVSAAALPSSPFGVDSAISSSTGLSMPGQIDLIFKTGARWVRDRFNWANAEPSSGTFTWTPAKTNDDALAALGLNVLQVISTSPNWTRAAGTTKDYPDDLQAAYGFAAAAAQNLSSVKAWEVWNEMDIASFSVQPPDLLAATVKAMALGFHSASTPPMVFNGPFGRDPTVGGYADILGENGISDYIGGSSFHTYHPVDSSFIGILDTNVEVHDTQLGIAGRPLFLSETGLAYALNGVPVPATAQAAQIRYLLAAYTAALSQGTEPAFWYSLRPAYQGGPTQFGLVDSQLCPFPVYTAFAVMTQLLKIGEYHDCIPWDGGGSGTNDSTAWVFNDGTNEVSVLIGPVGTDTLTLPTAVSGVVVYNVMGGSETVTASGSALTVSSKGYPVYLVMPPGQHISSAPAPTPVTPAAQNPSSIVMRVDYPADHIALDTSTPVSSYDGVLTNFAPRGYAFTPGETISFTVDVYNFTSSSVTGSLAFVLPTGFSATPSSPSVTVVANGKTTVSVSILTASTTPAVPGNWQCNGTFSGAVIAPSSALWGPVVTPTTGPTCP